MQQIQKALIQKDNKILVMLRSAEAKFFPEHWDLPGGKLEANEDRSAGLEREVFEETQLKVKTQEILKVLDIDLEYNGQRIPHQFTVYSVEILSGEVKLSHEHTDYKWYTKEEILKLKLEPYLRLLLNS